MLFDMHNLGTSESMLHAVFMELKLESYGLQWGRVGKPSKALSLTAVTCAQNEASPPSRSDSPSRGSGITLFSPESCDGLQLPAPTLHDTPTSPRSPDVAASSAASGIGPQHAPKAQDSHMVTISRTALQDIQHDLASLDSALVQSRQVNADLVQASLKKDEKIWLLERDLKKAMESQKPKPSLGGKALLIGSRAQKLGWQRS